MRSAYVSGNSLGMYLTGSGSYTLKNNYVSLSNIGSTIRMSLYGIADELTSGSTLNCYNNTVVISGSQTSGGSPGQQFVRLLPQPGRCRFRRNGGRQHR